MLRSDEVGKDLSMKEMLEQERQKLVGYLRQAQKVSGSRFVRLCAALWLLEHCLLTFILLL
jgi:seryl-tRNA synthetase